MSTNDNLERKDLDIYLSGQKINTNPMEYDSNLVITIKSRKKYNEICDIIDIIRDQGSIKMNQLIDGNTDVIINTGTAVVNSNQSCRSLTTKGISGVTVNTGFTLTVTH